VVTQRFLKPWATICASTNLAESRDLARAFEDATGRVLDWFFDQWVLRGAGHPVLSVELSWDGKRKMLVVTVAQTQTIDATTPRFRIPTMLRVVAAGGASRDIPIEITEVNQTFHIPLSAEPSQAIFDPGGVVLARTTTTKPLPWWRNQLRCRTR
jgi:aminopeptidase N